MTATFSLMQRQPTDGSFKKGTSGNPRGKPRGAVNRVTKQAREAAALIVDDPEYRDRLRERIIAGQAPQMEVLMWTYAKGKPVDRVEHGAPGSFALLSDEELCRKLKEALTQF